MIIHPAVCIIRLFLSCADDVMTLFLKEGLETIAEVWTLFRQGRERCRLNWLRRANMENVMSSGVEMLHDENLHML